jgi:hypothetical protein
LEVIAFLGHRFSSTGPPGFIVFLHLRSGGGWVDRQTKRSPKGTPIVWDQEGADLGTLQRDSRAALAGGKSRLIPGFDYSDGGSVRAIY